MSSDLISGTTLMPTSTSSTSTVPLEPDANVGHLTAVMVYVLLTFFTLFVLTGIFGIFGYIIQRLHRAHLKRRCSRRLIIATRKALRMLPLRTLQSSDKEVKSGCDQCAICIELYRSNEVIRILPCQHFYHKKCIDPWLMEQRSCPLCKLDILKSCGLISDSLADELQFIHMHHDYLSSSSSSLSDQNYPVNRPESVFTLTMGELEQSDMTTPLGTTQHSVRSFIWPSPHGEPPTGDVHFNASGKSFQPINPIEQQQSSSKFRFLDWLLNDCFHYNSWPVSHKLITSDADRLCSHHATYLGVANLPVRIQLAHWRSYASHLTALEQHWSDVQQQQHATFSTTGKKEVQSVICRCIWVDCHPLIQFLVWLKQRFIRGMQCIHVFPKLLDSQLKTRGFENADTKEMSHQINNRNAPIHPAKASHEIGHCYEQTVVVHYSKDTSPSPSCSVDPQMSCGNSHGAKTNLNRKPHFNSNERLPALPPLSTGNVNSASSSDASSEPSLIVLPPTHANKPYHHPSSSMCEHNHPLLPPPPSYAVNLDRPSKHPTHYPHPSRPGKYRACNTESNTRRPKRQSKRLFNALTNKSFLIGRSNKQSYTNARLHRNSRVNPSPPAYNEVITPCVTSNASVPMPSESLTALWDHDYSYSHDCPMCRSNFYRDVLSTTASREKPLTLDSCDVILHRSEDSCKQSPKSSHPLKTIKIEPPTYMSVIVHAESGDSREANCTSRQISFPSGRMTIAPPEVQYHHDPSRSIPSDKTSSDISNSLDSLAQSHTISASPV